MPKEKNTESEKLHELEKLVKKIIRKNLKDETLDYTVQVSRSSLETGKTKYSAMISSPAKGVQPILYSFSTYNELKSALEASLETLDRKDVELAFHQDRINAYTNKIAQHKERIEKIESGEDDEDIELEEV